MATNYSPTIVTDGAVFVGDARMPSISEPGTRVYNRAGVNSADVKLLIHGNVGSGQSFTDSSLSNHTVTAVGDATHSTTQSKFSGGSIYFDGSDSLSVPDSADWNIGSGDFTMDAWVYFSGTSNVTLHNQSTGSAASDSAFIIWVSGTIGIYLSDGTGWDYSNVNSATLSSNQWYHMAAVRYGDSLKMYVNGVSTSSTSLSSGWTVGDSSRVLQIGEQDGGSYLNGYLDEVRFIKGAALWTQDFTPPARRDTLSISDGMMYNGTCLNFDNTDDYITINGFASNDPGTDSAWAVTFRARGDTATGSANHDMVFSGHTTSGGNIIRIGYDRTNGGIFYSDDNTTDKYAGTTFYNDNTWHHVVITRPSGSGAQTTDVYVDGAKTTGGTFSTSDPTWASATQFSIGQEYDGGAPGDYFDGNLADIRVYNVKLSATQVTELYNDSKVVVPSNVSLTNLLGWWPLCEGAGSVAYDGSGKGSHGTLVNNPGWNTGQTGCPQLVEGYNRPMLFDGSSDYLKCGDVGNFTGSLSISLWFYANSNASSSRLIAKDMASGGNPRWLIYKSTGTSLILYFNDNVNTATTLAAAFSTYGTWHHVAATITSGSAKFYIDGALVTSSTETTSSFTTDNDLWIGRYASSSYFDGIINEVVLHNSVLTLAQVQALAATGPNGGPLPPDPMSLSNSSNVIGYWRNDGNVTWADRSGNGYTGTVYGSPPSLLFKQGINGSASTSTGRDNQGFPLKYKDVGAIGFVNDSVDFGDVISFDNTDNFTVEAWFQADVASGMDSYQPIVSKEGSSEFGYGLKIDRVVAGGPWFYGIATGTTNRYQYAAALTNGEWYHGCVLFSSSTNYITVFINGEQSHGPYSSQGAFSGTTSTNSLKFGQTGSSFTGQIGSSKIYNRLLSHAEIKQNYKAQRSRFE